MQNSKSPKENNNKEFQPVQNVTMGEANFNQFMWLRNQQVIAVENFGREESLFPVVIPTMYEDMGEQLKLVHKVVDKVKTANRKIWWLCSGTVWLSQRVPMPMSKNLQGRRRKRSFNKLSIWFINLKKLYI